MSFNSRILTIAGSLRLRGRSGFPANAARRLLDRAGGPPPQFWSIGIYAGDSPLSLGPLIESNEAVISAADVTDIAARFVADPFMLRTDSGWHMFFEVMNAETGRGEIGHASSGDGRSWNYGRRVLTEPFHLSYPFVFQHKGESYMIPETIDGGGVRLYQAADFPQDWRHVGTLIEGRFVDPSLIRHDGRWWMFAGEGYGDPSVTLRLFHAEELFGPWREHPASPIIEDDPLTARPAGRPVVVDGRIIRFAQGCRPDYGTNVAAFRVDVLTPGEYSERPLADGPILSGSGRGWNRDGMHHVDAHQLADGTWIAAVDGWLW
jgi:hypothetical protein